MRGLARFLFERKFFIKPHPPWQVFLEIGSDVGHPEEVLTEEIGPFLHLRRLLDIRLRLVWTLFIHNGCDYSQLSQVAGTIASCAR